MAKIVYAQSSPRVSIVHGGSLYPSSGVRRCRYSMEEEKQLYLGAGKSGVVRKIWCANPYTWATYVMYSYKVRVWVDRGDLPSGPTGEPDLELPFERLFGMSYVQEADERNLSMLPHAGIQVTGDCGMWFFGHTQPLDIPFGNGIWLACTGSNIAYVEWDEGLSGDYADCRLYAIRWSGTIPYGEEQVVADIGGRGMLFATYAKLHGLNDDITVYENNIKIYLNGESVPWESSSTEDYFSNCYFFVNGERYDTLTGTFYANSTQAKAECYRYLDIPFRNGAQVVVPNTDNLGHTGFEIDWLTLYYGDTPPGGS